MLLLNTILPKRLRFAVGPCNRNQDLVAIIFVSIADSFLLFHGFCNGTVKASLFSVLWRHFEYPLSISVEEIDNQSYMQRF